MPRLIYTLLFIVYCNLVSFLSAQGTLKEEELLVDFQIFESSLQQNHPQLFLYSSKQKLNSFFKEAKAKLKGDMNPIEFFRILTPILPMIGNNHTNISPPKPFIEFISKEAKRIPFSLFYQSDSFYVLEDASKEYTIKEGNQITAINGMDVSLIIQTFLANISTDGYNKTQPLYRASRGFSRYYAYYFGFPETFEVNYVDSSGNSRIALIEAISTDEITKNRKARMAARANNPKEFKFEVIHGVGVLTISTFSISEPKLFKRFLRETFQEINTKDIGKLIIDLRDNMGGYPEASNQLLKYLIYEPVFPYKLEYAITDKVHNQEYFEEDIFYKHFQRQKLIEREGKYFIKGAVGTVVEPSKDAYHKELYVLMNANSSSTTGQLIGLIKSYTKASFIGEESGGNPVGIVANDILTLILPNSKIEVKLPLIYSELNVDFENSGRGIVPDKSFTPTIVDLLSEEDRVLSHALEWISKKE